jgi:hypothetical protein
VPGGGPRRGRRDNGLIAAEYAVAGDVDPRIGEHLLDVLAAGGIAAYLQPSTDLHPVTRTASLPARPTDRLYVDRTHLNTAQDYLQQVGADSDRAADPDLDAVWRDIVAGYDVRVDPTAHPWPAVEDVESNDGSAQPVAGSAEASDAPQPPHGERSRVETAAGPRDEPSLLDGLDTVGADLPDEDDEGYTPPPAPPLPRISRAAALALIAIGAGLVLFIWPDLLPLGADTVLLVGFAAILTGFVTLVWRLRSGDGDEDDDGDDGARV